VTGRGAQVGRVNDAVVDKNLARAPGDALLEQCPGGTQAVHDLERSLRPADGAAAIREACLPVDDDARLATGGKAKRSRQTYRPCADDDHPMVRRLQLILL